MAKIIAGAKRVLSDVAYGLFTPYREEEQAFQQKWGDIGPALQLKLGLLAHGPFIGEIETGKGKFNTCAVMQIYQMKQGGNLALVDGHARSGRYEPAETHLRLIGQAANGFNKLHVYEMASEHPGGRRYGTSVSNQTDLMTLAARWQMGRFGEALALGHDYDPTETMVMGPSHSKLSSATVGLPRRGLLPTLRKLRSRVSGGSAEFPPNP